MFSTIAITVLATITLLPAVPAAALIALLGPFAAPLAILVYLVGYGLVAGVMSRPFAGSVQAGKFTRDLTSSLYRGRRLYGLCWTAIYYNPPVLHLFLAVPALKHVMLRLFAYRGALDVTIYPDTWIRDLPLLDLGAGAYLANKATLGTNLVLANGTILVGGVKVGTGAVIGHGSGIAPGARIGDGAEVGFSAAVGIKSRIGARSKLGGMSTVEHGVIVGRDVVIGVGCTVGSGVRIADGLIIPAGTVVPARTALRDQDDVELLLVGRSSPRRTTAQVAIAFETASSSESHANSGNPPSRRTASRVASSERS